ncbi:hypothetical protein [Leptolyngbya sp. FACHB-261]|uniref:hypothetical protein n=1 Tax=Leptolyngbya sp. FACHB-261 TaxID=2692806 RepID=UPI001685D36B|nr:hypothetical protein [Leptolyngbya sp. FACHB-261]MBD2101181.1 hypothetical protein [Leptolyngbya sp. FACHB-261]
MNDKTVDAKDTSRNQGDASTGQYDRGIVPAEVAARQEREGASFKQTPSLKSEENARTNDQTEDDSIDTTDGYTVDQEGLLNNYAIEPEMYVNEPGDLREEEAELAKERVGELEDANEGSEGELTAKRDLRGKGPGLV